jgi:hypothetical protein
LIRQDKRKDKRYKTGRQGDEDDKAWQHEAEDKAA